MVYTEIPADMLTSVLASPEKMARCDVIALLYENERDQADFLRNNISKLPDLVPKILLSTKAGFTGSQEALARDLGGIRITKRLQVNAHDNRFTEVLSELEKIAMEPTLGLSHESVELAKSRCEKTLLEEWFGFDNVSDMTAVVGVTAAISVAALGIYQYKRKMRI